MRYNKNILKRVETLKSITRLIYYEKIIIPI